MKVNNECIKAVLNYVIDNVKVVFDTSGAGYEPISTLSIIQALSKNEKFTQEEIFHSCIYASKCGYLETDKRYATKNNIPSLIDLVDVTPSGYEFLEK